MHSARRHSTATAAVALCLCAPQPAAHPAPLSSPPLLFSGHAKELNNPIPKSPLLFLKPPSSIITQGQTVKLPRTKRRARPAGMAAPHAAAVQWVERRREQRLTDVRSPSVCAGALARRDRLRVGAALRSAQPAAPTSIMRWSWAW